MVEGEPKALSIEAAARLIYGTAQPTPQQIYQVRDKLRKQLLQGGSSGSTNTVSAKSLAEYMAQHELHRPAAAAGARSSKHLDTGNRQLKSVYKDLLTDYFMAVLLRRKAQSQSKLFARAVLAGQVLLAVGLFGGMTLAILGSQVSISPERRAIDSWITEQMGSHQVLSWGKPQPDPSGSSVRIPVSFRFNQQPSGKPTETTRLFVLSGGQVVSADSPE